MTVTEISIKAKEAGMSYGEYVNQMGDDLAPTKEPKPQNPNTKECLVCGSKFVTTRGNKKYCSEECRIRAGYASTKAKKRSLTPICLRSVKICPTCCL